MGRLYIRKRGGIQRANSQSSAIPTMRNNTGISCNGTAYHARNLAWSCGWIRFLPTAQGLDSGFGLISGIWDSRSHQTWADRAVGWRASRRADCTVSAVTEEGQRCYSKRDKLLPSGRCTLRAVSPLLY